MYCDMCKEYGRHKKGCPNKPPVKVCENCGDDLYEGDYYYPDIPACEHCLYDTIENMLRVL